MKIPALFYGGVWLEILEINRYYNIFALFKN